MLEKVYLDELIPKDLRKCGAGYIHVFQAFDPPDELWVKATCSKPWCGSCEAVKVWRRQRKNKKYLDHNSPKRLYIVTRSVRNTSTLLGGFNSLRDAQLKFSKHVTRQADHPLNKVTAWVATTEIVYANEKGWNVHEHMIWGLNQSLLKEDYLATHKYWDRAAGFRGAHINIIMVRDSQHAANYVAKYLSKGVWGGLSQGRAYQVRAALKGRNRIQSKRGTLPPEEKSGYCFCCSTLWESGCDGEGERPWSLDFLEGL